MLLRRRRYDFGGLVGALVLFGVSVTPSLLPRSGLFQGLVSGILAATGYGIGALLGAVVRRVSSWRPGSSLRRNAWRGLAGTGVVVVAVALVMGALWQGEVHRLVGAQPPGRWTFVIVLLVAVLVAGGLVGIARLLRKAARGLGQVLARWIPAPVAAVAGAVLVAILTRAFIQAVLVESLYAMADSAFATVNGETTPGTSAPSTAERSGSPQSDVTWASLGRMGRNFVSGGPSAEEISAFTGSHALTPIRVYTGLGSPGGTGERAALAVQELERTAAFSRAAIVVTTTTGTGWVDENGVSPLEYMYGGDTAIVSLQYSYLPSWLSFLVDGERAREAGRELFDQVHARWAELPAHERPELLVFGESMGSFGGEAAFRGVSDIRARSDGVLWVGPPNSNALWSAFTAQREEGTREALPVYGQGDTVRFAATAVDLDRPASRWAKPRVLYLQHASDPVTWWSPGLLVDSPDWLEEERGPDVEPAVRWWPFVTFWQVTADMVNATKVPPGHGHSYGTAPAAAWAEIAPPPGWTGDDTARLRALLEDLSEDPG